MRLALYQPDIPQNTGTILRLAACVEVPVDVIEPAGFDMSDRALRRAGLDYLQSVELTRHMSWQAFCQWRAKVEPDSRVIAVTARASLPHIDFTFCSRDILLMGRESAGLPDAVHAAADAAVRIPISQATRSLNVAVAAAIVTSEALRQTQTWPTAR